MEFGQDIRPRKTIQTLSVWQNIQNQAEVIFNDSIRGSQELGSSVNK